MLEPNSCSIRAIGARGRVQAGGDAHRAGASGETLEKVTVFGFGGLSIYFVDPPRKKVFDTRTWARGSHCDRPLS